MTGLIIVGVILVVLAVIAMLRVGVICSYSEDGVEVFVRIGPMRVQVVPKPEKVLSEKQKAKKEAKEKKKKEEKKKKKEEKKNKKAQEAKSGEAKKKGGSFETFRKLLPIILDALAQFHRRLSIDLLEIDFTAAGDDPAKTAMTYGYANASVGAIVPVLEKHFNVKKRSINIAVDFLEPKPIIYVRASLSLMIWDILCIGGRTGFRFLRSGILTAAKGDTKNKSEKMAEDNTGNKENSTGKVENNNE